MVDAGDQRDPRPLDVEHPVTQDLIVMGDVEITRSLGKEFGHSGAKSAGLGKSSCAHGQELTYVGEVAEFAGLGDPERVWLAVQVKARHLGQGNPFIELGIGLTREDLDAVTQFHQLAAEMSDVDPLAAAVRLAPIGQQRDAHR